MKEFKCALPHEPYVSIFPTETLTPQIMDDFGTVLCPCGVQTYSVEAHEMRQAPAKLAAGMRENAAAIRRLDKIIATLRAWQ